MKKKYYCSNHKGEVERDLLIAKKVLFVEMGEGGRSQRSRIVAWLCPRCLVEDEDWQRPSSRGSRNTPGMEMKT